MNGSCSRRTAWLGHAPCDRVEFFWNNLPQPKNTTVNSWITFWPRIRLNPVILHRSDHGGTGHENLLPAATEPAIDRSLLCYANLIAMRLPKRCAGMARDDITLVGRFRVVFTCFGDTDLPQRTDRLFTGNTDHNQERGIKRGIIQ